MARTSGTSWPQPWRLRVDGEEVFGGQVVDPLDLEGLAGAGFDERGERRCGP